MTRGNFLLITDTANWMSIQFNGDMYPSCNGKFVYHMLESVETYDDLAAAILKFDEERFGYADMHYADLAPESISDDIDFSKDYFAIYNSDYLYIKNASNKDCTIITKRFITRNISIIFQNIICNPLVKNGEELMVGLINDKVFTDTALKRLLKEVEKVEDTQNLTILKTYILNSISNCPQNTFRI